MSRLTLLASLFVLTTFFTAPAQNGTSELLLAKELISEDPPRAIAIAQKALSSAATSPTSRITAFTIIAEAAFITNQKQIALAAIDSANHRAKHMQHTGLPAIIERVNIRSLLIYNKPNEAFKLIDKRVTDYKKSKNTTPESIQFLLFAGDVYRQAGIANQSIELKRAALEMALKANNDTLRTEALLSLGSTYWTFSLLKDALAQYSKGYNQAKASNDTLRLLVSLRNIGLTYRDIGNFDSSSYALQTALALAQKTKSERIEAEIRNILGGLYLKFNRYNQAIAEFESSLRIREKLKHLDSQADLLDNLGRAYKHQGNYNQALENLEKALRLREEILDEQAKASTLNEAGNIYAEKGELAEALRRYLMALKIRQELELKPDIAKSLINIGITYRKLGASDRAIDYFANAHKILLQSNDPIEIAYVLLNLGNSYLDTKSYGKAIEAYQKAATERQKAGDLPGLAKVLVNQAQAYRLQNNQQAGIEVLKKAQSIAIQIKSEAILAEVLNETGNIYQSQGNVNNALKSFAESEKHYANAGMQSGVALCLRKQGEILAQTGSKHDAENMLKRSLQIGEQIKSAPVRQYALYALYTFYNNIANADQALKYFRNYSALKDSLSSIEQLEKTFEARYVAELDTKRTEIKIIEDEVESLQKESELKELQLERQRIFRLLLIIIIVLGAAMLTTLLFAYRQKRKNNNALSEKLTIINETNDRLRESEQQLRLMVQTRDKLFSIIAHDLKNPFNALVGLTELLSIQSAELEREEIKEYSNLIHHSANKVLTLLENLLQWARSQTGKLNVNPTLLNLKEITNECIEFAALNANSKEVTLSQSINNNTFVYADKDTLATVIRNLLSNAIKFTPKGGLVSLQAISTANAVTINITDTGVGIAQENLDKLFRIDKSYTTEGTEKESGTGLGLIICKEFIERNAGTISVSSKLEQGTTFTITLPSKEQ
ncbi:MAG: tetratricopeptide repeat protein [Bacteroidales bacterium]|nr:tetratricopeptide repeat protein [Bacteroidales bacterium]MBN2750168.1 tetratricopeptide repeat protein [Bacteroidales bacterium]